MGPRRIAAALLSGYVLATTMVLALGGPLLGDLDLAAARSLHGAVPSWVFLPVGRAHLLVAAILVVALWERHAGNPRRALSVAVALAVTVVVYSATKLLTAIPRPYVALGVPPYVPGTPLESFPSGHAALAGLLLAARPWRPRGAVALGAVLAYVAASRVILGMHHPSDVVVGASLGIAVGGVLRTRTPPPEP